MNMSRLQRFTALVDAKTLGLQKQDALGRSRIEQVTAFGQLLEFLQKLRAGMRMAGARDANE